MLAGKLTRSRGRQSAGTRVEIPKSQKAIARREPMHDRLKAHHMTLFGLSPTQAKGCHPDAFSASTQFLLQLVTGRRPCQSTKAERTIANLPRSQIPQTVVAP